MRIFRLKSIPLYLLLCFLGDVTGLKCRTATDSQQNNDFEYVVRMCLRHLRNESDIYDLYKQTDYDSSSNKRHRDDMLGDSNSNGNVYNNNNGEDRNYYNKNRGYHESLDHFWSPSSWSHNRNRYWDEERNRQEGDYLEPDYSGGSRYGKDEKKKLRGRPQMPHSYQQQQQHDRDIYSRGNRDSDGYFYTYRNKNTKLSYNKDRNSDSPLADIDPCVVHCIFQELQMVDDNGKPNKGLISQKMTQKIWNSELKNFIQDSVDKCFDAIDDNDFENNYNANSNNNSNKRYRKPEVMCDWAKTFAICLEDKGRESCEDWNEPIQKNHSGSNSKSNEDHKHKSNQNDRG